MTWKLQYRWFNWRKQATVFGQFLSDELTWLDWGTIDRPIEGFDIVFYNQEDVLLALCKRYGIKRDILKEVFPNRYRIGDAGQYQFRIVSCETEKEHQIDWTIGLNDSQ